MKVSRLIELLRKGDPTGKAEVAVYHPGDDFFFGIVNMDVVGGGRYRHSLHIHIGDLEDELE